MQRQVAERLSAGASPAEIGDPIASLSRRALEVLRLIGQGFATREIAIQLNRSIKTIETHRANLKDKPGLKTGAELIRFAALWLRSLV